MLFLCPIVLCLLCIHRFTNLDLISALLACPASPFPFIDPIQLSPTFNMAAADVLTPSLPPTPSFGTIKRKRSSSAAPNPLINMPSTIPRQMTFEPVKHLSFQPPGKIYSMEEIGHKDRGVSPIAVSDPFPLFTEEAIQQMRAEVLSKPVWDNCKYSSNLAHCQLRGFAPE